MARRAGDGNWDLIRAAVAAEQEGRPPRLFSSQRTLFGIPSALDQELAKLGEGPQGGTPAAASPSAGPGRQTVAHPLEPLFDERSRVLMLGTMPSPKSREAGFYYGHPRNRFWPVIARLFGQQDPGTIPGRRKLALDHGIALWDVLASCSIEGAKDMSIAECVPNDLTAITNHAPIQAVFCTGAKAAELYGRYCQDATGIPAVRLPSTSPANAAASLDDLVEAYGQILPYCP